MAAIMVQKILSAGVKKRKGDLHLFNSVTDVISSQGGNRSPRNLGDPIMFLLYDVF